VGGQEGGWEIEQGRANFKTTALAHAATIGEPQTLFITVGRAGVRWPIYRTILLVPTVLA
jgi:hypothetical protein